MIVYNVTIKVDAAIAQSWLDWLLKEHIPDVMNTDCFATYKVLRHLEASDKDGPTYTIQYIAENIESYKKYISDFALELRKKTFEKWGDAFVAFRSVMEVVQ